MQVIPVTDRFRYSESNLFGYDKNVKIFKEILKNINLLPGLICTMSFTRSSALAAIAFKSHKCYNSKCKEIHRQVTIVISLEVQEIESDKKSPFFSLCLYINLQNNQNYLCMWVYK